MIIKGMVPSPITGELVEIEVEITDPVLIDKIQKGFINDLSLEPKAAVPMTDNVFDNADESLRKAKDEAYAILGLENDRHESVLKIETEFHNRRVAELKRVLYMFGESELISAPKLPHSRACVKSIHAHGSYCSINCPTCHGKHKVGGWK